MDIEEAKIRKTDLEKELLVLIEKFETDAEVRVDSIYLNPLTTSIAGDVTKVVELTVTI